MITEIHEHSVDLSLLPERGAKIIDLGCRGFQFTDFFKEKGYVVASVDIEDFKQQVYYRLAITGKDGRVGIHRNNDPQATRVTEGDELLSMRLDTFMNSLGIEFADLIKIDIEGAEAEVIMSLKKAPAKQLSIEFHLHTGIYGQSVMQLMEAKLSSLGYEAVQHKLEERHGAGFNYWDSLFILK